MMETYHGFVRTPADAIKLFEACRIGLLPRVQRRLSEKERQSIRSGSVFVWDEREAGMRRWTDGKSWSASRVSGSFLTYREMEGKRGGGFGNSRRGAGKTPDSSGRGSDEDQDEGEPDGYRYKADGLMKQSFSITTSTGQHLHLISYYSRPQAGQPELPNPSTDPNLRHILPVKGMYPESSMTDAQVPPMTRAPMQTSPYMHAQPHQHPHPHPAAHAYPPHYVQHGYPNWPMAPATPPYSHHYTVAPAYLPPGHMHQPHPAHHYAPYASPPPGPVHYERALPPPVTSAPQTRTPPMGTLMPYGGHHSNGYPSPRMAQPRAIPEPAPATHTLQQQQQQPQQPQPQPQQQPQSQAQGQPYIDPRLAAVGTRNQQGPLPALGPKLSTPPPRHASASPPRLPNRETNGHANGNPPAAPTPNGNKASISALLHPMPAPNTSPRSGLSSTAAVAAAAAAAVANGQHQIQQQQQPPPQQKQTLPSIQQFREDVRALGALDKKFLQTTS